MRSDRSFVSAKFVYSSDSEHPLYSKDGPRRTWITLDANLNDLGEGEFQAQIDLPADAQAWFFNFITGDDLVVSSEYCWPDKPQEEEQVDPLRYSLVSGSGDTHNKKFSLSDTGELVALQSFDLEEMGDELSIRVPLPLQLHHSIDPQSWQQN